MVFAKTDPDGGARGISSFLVPLDLPGIQRHPYSDMGARGIVRGSLFLDNVEIPADHLIGTEGGGFVQVMQAFDYTRALIGLCAIQVGVSNRALRMAAEYTTGREQFGRPIGSFQAVQQRMADGFIDLEAIRWTTWHAAWLVAQGRPADRAARVAKFWAAEAGARIAATTQHVHGGIGIDTTYPLHRYFLWAKHNELTLGSATQQLAHLGSTYPEGRL